VKIAYISVRLVGTDKEKIVNETVELLDNSLLYERISKATNPYGDGRAAERIVQIIGELVKR